MSKTGTIRIMSIFVALVSMVLIALPVQAEGTGITSNFNGTPIASGNYIWFNSVFKPSGGPTDIPYTVYLQESQITFAANNQIYTLTVPNAEITFSPTATGANTTWNSGSNTWITVVPMNYASGNIFLSGMAFPVPDGGLPGGINPVTWSGRFLSDTPGVTVNWKWAAAVYSDDFLSDGDYNSLGVKPVDMKTLLYPNSHHAGTPEYKLGSGPLGGSRGGGGANYTGSYSGTAKSYCKLIDNNPA